MGNLISNHTFHCEVHGSYLDIEDEGCPRCNREKTVRKECAAPGCHVLMFGDDDLCQHHEGMAIFDEQYGTDTFPKEKDMPTDTKDFLDQVKATAKKEIEEEEFRDAVDRMKVRMRQAKWWHKFVPFKLLIVRRENV